MPALPKPSPHVGLLFSFPDSSARPLLSDFGMSGPEARRCAIWLTPALLRKAQELATLAGVDVDDFIAYVVNELHLQEQQQGAMRAHAAGSIRDGERPAGARQSGRDGAEVIPMRGNNRRRVPSSSPRP